jgi:hypothetical protein
MTIPAWGLIVMIAETPALGSSAGNSWRAKLRDHYGLSELGGIAVPRVNEPIGWAICGGRGGLAGGLSHKRLSVKQNFPGRIELGQEIKIKNIAGQHGAAMLSSCGE